MQRGFWIAPALAAIILASPASAAGLLGGLVDVSSGGLSVNVPHVVEVNVGASGSGLGVDASVLPGTGGGVDANVGIGSHSGGLGIGADVSVLRDTSSGGINAGADACIGRCGVNADADASIFGNHNGGIDANASLGIGGGNGIRTGTGVSVLNGVNAGVGVSLFGNRQPGTPPNPPRVIPPATNPDRPVWASIPPQMSTTPVSLGSSKLRMVDRIIRNRAWLAFQAGAAVCLPHIRIATMQSWLPGRDMDGLGRLVRYHRSEIIALQAMLQRCAANRLSAADISRIVGVDIGPDGLPILFML